MDHCPIKDALDCLENKANPTAADRAYLFDCVFLHYEELMAEHAGEAREIKRSLLDYLFEAMPGLAKSARALRRDFERKIKRWIADGRKPGALADQRPVRSGRHRTPDFAEDKQKIVAATVTHGGLQSLAYRKLRLRGEFSEEFCAYYSYDVRRNKSYVPDSIRTELTPIVKAALPLALGPKEAKLRGPYIPRDWSDVRPGDYFTADDVTLNHYYWYTDEQGEPQITRGECLLMTDLRTGYPLEFALVAGRYNSEHIRSVVLKVHDHNGLPHVGCYFEGGVWRARLIEGPRRRHAEQVSWRETEAGLRDYGLWLRVRHATTPRAKPIEGLLRILQERMRPEPGHVGPDEKKIKYERMQDFLARVRRGKEHPANDLLSAEQWAQRLSRILEEFANEPQNGKMLPGVSPAEAWRVGLERRPLRKLPDQARYLLATHKQIVSVDHSGITLRIRGEDMIFCCEETGYWIGRQALAFYNIEQPDLLTASDLKREHFFSAKRIPRLPAMSATSEQFAEVNSQISTHKRAAKLIWGSIQHRLVAAVTRDNEITPSTTQLGEFHNRAVAEHQAEQKQTERKMREIRKLANALGTAAPATVRNPDRVLEGMQWEIEARAKIAKDNSPQSTA